jgi:hypothetical protein
VNDSKKEDEIYMIFAYGIELDREATSEALWARDEEQARDILKSQSDRCFRGYTWGGGEWGPDWDKERLAFVVALLRVPETWRTLMEDGEGQILPKGRKCETDDELHRYMVEAEAVTAIMTPSSDPETQWDDYL